MIAHPYWHLMHHGNLTVLLTTITYIDEASCVHEHKAATLHTYAQLVGITDVRGYNGQ